MILTGGPVVWILLVMALVALITYFERMLDLRRAQIDCQDFLKGVVNVLASGNDAEALAICDDLSVPVAQVVATAIRHRDGSVRELRDAVDAQGRSEIGRLDRRLAVLAIIAQTAPFLGLLGTIIGFIRTVLLVNSQAVISRADLMNGSMEALVAAAVGLGVSIPVMIMHASLRVRLERIVVELEASASMIVGYLSGGKDEVR